MILGGWFTDSTLTVVDDFVFVALTIPATVFAALTARSLRGRLRLAWLSMAVGLLGWGVGEAIWTYYEVQLREVPLPSLADAAYLVFPVGACAALLLFPGRSQHSVAGAAVPRRVHRGGIAVPGELGDHPAAAVPVGTRRVGWDSSVSLAYPISDIVILTVAGVVLVRASGDHRLSLIL